MSGRLWQQFTIRPLLVSSWRHARTLCGINTHKYTHALALVTLSLMHVTDLFLYFIPSLCLVSHSFPLSLSFTHRLSPSLPPLSFRLSLSPSIPLSLSPSLSSLPH